MNGSEIEQSSITAGSAFTEMEEPPGSNYQPSFSYNNSALLQPPDHTNQTSKRAETTPSNARRPTPNLRTRAFRRKFYPDVKDSDWNDWRWQSRHRVRKLDQLERMLVLSDDEREALAKGESMLPVG